MRQEERIGDRYAQGLLEAAREAGVEKTVAEDLSFIEGLTRAVPEFLPFLAHPRIALEIKERVVEEVGHFLHPYTRNLLRLLVRRGRAALIPELSAAYFQALEKAGGPVYVVVRAASPLTREFQESLRARLQEALGQEVILAEEVAPELLAGAELVISGRRLDASLRGRLHRLRRALGG